MRASEAPEQWKLLLDAVNANDYELANKLAIKYNFGIKANEEKTVDNVRHKPLKGDYVALDPNGKMYCHEIGGALSRYLGLTRSYVSSAAVRLGRHNAVKKGKMKGWVFWREL